MVGSLPKATVKYPVKSLIKALNILEAIADNGPQGITELGKHLGLRLSTVHRLLGTLKGKGYVLTDPLTSRYMLGGTVARIGDALSRQSPLLVHGQVAVEQLSLACNESVNLGLLEGTDIVYAARHESRYSLRIITVLGMRWPAHSTALGKVCLAGMTDDEVIRLYSRAKKLQRLTPKTVTDIPELLNQLAAIRAKGMAYDDEENSLGTRCIAVPVHGHSGAVVAALSISGPKARLTPKHLKELTVQLIKSGADLSAKLGYSKLMTEGA
jgi:DNA-binding IclR family transcriptional regulator